MSYDVFVYFKVMPANFAEAVATGVKAAGFDLHVEVVPDRAYTKITIGTWDDESDNTMECWVETLKAEGSPSRQELAETAQDIEDPVHAERLREACYEIHCSSQHIGGEDGLYMLTVCPAVIAAAAEGGLVFNPQAGGYILPETFLAGLAAALERHK